MTTFMVGDEIRKVQLIEDGTIYEFAIYHGNQVYSYNPGNGWRSCDWTEFPERIQGMLLWELLAAV